MSVQPHTCRGQGAKPRLNRARSLALAGSFLGLLLPASLPAAAQDAGATVTLLTGTPRIAGQSIRQLQPIRAGSLAEIATGENDALGLLVQDIVVHQGQNSLVSMTDDGEEVVIHVERGFIAFYLDGTSQRHIVVETPFGRLSPILPASQEGDTGVFTVRHEEALVNMRPAASTFSVVEGSAEARGTAPVAGPHLLRARQMWVIREGEPPGEPVEGDERLAAEELSSRLHRDTIEALRPELTDITPRDEHGAGGIVMVELTRPDGQAIIESSDVAELLEQPPFFEEPQEFELRLSPAIIEPSGVYQVAEADFVSYAGDTVHNTPPNAWFDVLTSVNGNPAFRPQYIAHMPNAGFTYIQLAGDGASLATAPLTGEQFLAGPAGTGWAMYTPTQAVVDPGFQAGDSALAVIDAGFERMAQAGHLANDGRIGPAAGDPTTGFAFFDGQNVVRNENPPAGYPLLQASGETTGLERDGVPLADQIAAIGAGFNTLDLGLRAPRLTFLSDADTTSFNFEGGLVTSTDLSLPGQRSSVQVDALFGIPSRAYPVANSANNTAGLQFARQGEVVAIVHHAGLRDLTNVPLPGNSHFEVERGDQYSVIRWVPENRPSDTDGTPLNFEDLNAFPEVRNDLFDVLTEEVNNVVPVGQSTIAGPAYPDTVVSGARHVQTGLRRFSASGTWSGHRFGASSDRALRRSGAWSPDRTLSLRTGLQRRVPAGVGRRYLGHETARP